MDGSIDQTPVSELFNPEQLVQRRIDLHHDLGRISARLCEAQSEYQECIANILVVNDELRNRGIDTSHAIYEVSRLENQEDDEEVSA